MLERQHAQLIGGLQELYRRTQHSDGGIGPRIDVGNDNQPLTHKILEALGMLQPDEWEDSEGVDCAWQDKERRGQDDRGWIYSGTGSPCTQAAFSPVMPTQTAFPQSTIMAFTPITQTMSMPPPFVTTSTYTKLDSYNYANTDPMPTRLTSFSSSGQVCSGSDQGPGPRMDWSLGVDALLSDLGSQEQSVRGY